MSREKDVKGKKPMLVPLQSEKRPKGTPVYRDPENPFNTWSGYGKRPVWLQERLSDGYLLDEMKLPGAVVDRDTKSLDTVTRLTRLIRGLALAVVLNG